jgi:hypothetical protein
LLIQQYCGIYVILLASNPSIYIDCRIYCQKMYAKNERSLQKLYGHSYLLPKVIAGIVL